MDKLKRILKYVFIFLGVSSVVAALVFFMASQYLWRVTGMPTDVVFSMVPKVDSMRPLTSAISEIAEKYQLVQTSQNSENKFSTWERKSKGFFSKDFDLTVRMEAHPYDEKEVRNLRLTLTVSTNSADKTDYWLEIAKELKNSLSSVTNISKIKIGLEPRVFGQCAVSDHPYEKIAQCSYLFDDRNLDRFGQFEIKKNKQKQ